MYDIFFVSKGAIDQDSWQQFKNRFPSAQKIDYVQSFEQVKSKSFTRFFWVIWDHFIVSDDFDLSYSIPKWDEEYIHVYKNKNYFDGICIFPKSARILQREWDYRFFTNKKELDIIASYPKPFDIVFISYHESNADKNYNNLEKKVKGNRLHRIDGVRGIHQAHIEAAKLATTDMFYVVDADAEIVNDFTFDYQIPYYDFNAKSTVHVWKSRNPVNGLEYGNGGVKLLPRQLTIDMDLSKPDMTTSISKWFKSMPTVSNITMFNTDPFNSWKSAFRECAKLASRIIDRQDDKETQHRLDVWCNETIDKDAVEGAIAGREFGIKYRTDILQLGKINDFAWLQEQFNGRYN